MFGGCYGNSSSRDAKEARPNPRSVRLGLPYPGQSLKFTEQKLYLYGDVASPRRTDHGLTPVSIFGILLVGLSGGHSPKLDAHEYVKATVATQAHELHVLNST